MQEHHEFVYLAPLRRLKFAPKAPHLAAIAVISSIAALRRAASNRGNHASGCRDLREEHNSQVLSAASIEELEQRALRGRDVVLSGFSNS